MQVEHRTGYKLDIPRHGAMSLKPGREHPLTPVLAEWAQLQKTFAKQESEPAFDHSEPANNSLLVAAAFSLKGWVGMAEHYVDRVKSDGRQGTGLCDVYLANQNRGFVVETKQLWLIESELKDQSLHKDRRTKLATARKQVEELQHEGCFASGHEIQCLWGGYFVPTIAKLDVDDYGSVFQKTWSLVAKRFSLIAWSFPKLPTEDIARHDRAVRPCVVLGLNDIKWNGSDSWLAEEI